VQTSDGGKHIASIASIQGFDAIPWIPCTRPPRGRLVCD
jgi:hypothetical protein